MNKFYLPNSDLDKEYSRLRLQVRSLMNGRTVEAMTQAGIHYKKNYGVSLVHLKELAKKLPHQPLLSERLWQSGVREFMILATLLPPPPSLTKTNLSRWIQEIPSMELSEISAMYLFSKLPQVEEVAEEIILTSAPEDASYQLVTALLIMSRLSGVPFSVDKLHDKNFAQTLSVQQALTRALINTARQHENEKRKVLLFLEQNPSLSEYCKLELSYI